jgi:hypothetical protein
VDEQSHKQDMAAALRGDFARLRARGVATTISVPDGSQGGAAHEQGEPAAADQYRRLRSRLRRLRRR